MNFAKLILIGLLSLGYATPLSAEGVPFAVSSANLPPPPSVAAGAGKETPGGSDTSDTQTNLISELKYRAIVEWLQGYLGARYANFDRYVTPEFAEKYILDYKVSRAAQAGGPTEVTGHLDADSLRKWIRLVESRYRGSTQLRPMFVISSNLPGMTISPGDTAARLRDSKTVELIHALVNQQFQKLNTRATPLESGIGFETPPKNDTEMKALRNASGRTGEGNSNSAIWVALSSCSSCGGARIDIFFYSLPAPRLVAVVGDDLNLSVRELSNTDTLKRLIAPTFAQFHTELEATISEGKVFNASFHVLFENIESYRFLKAIELEMTKSDFVTNPVFKRAESKAAEFEVSTALSQEELSRRLLGLEVAGNRPKLSRMEGTTIVLRYK